MRVIAMTMRLVAVVVVVAAGMGKGVALLVVADGAGGVDDSVGSS